MVLSCMMGSTVDIAHKRGSTAAITALMSIEPSSAALIFGSIVRSQIPVRLDGARISGSGSDGRLGVVFAAGPGNGLVATGAASSAGHPKREASSVARSPPAALHPTMASTRLLTSDVPYSTGGSCARTVAAIPALRS